MPAADNAGFANTAGTTDFCTGARTAPCARLATLFQSWATPLALLVAVIGTLSALAGLFHGNGLGSGREQGPEASWAPFLQRLKTALLISFLAWRVGGLLGLVESLWLQHTGEGVTTAEGLPLPPTSFVRAAYVVLFLDLVQLLLFWVVLRMLMTSLYGVAAFSGLSKHAFGEVLRAQVKWLVLLVLTLVLPPVLSTLYSLMFG